MDCNANLYIKEGKNMDGQFVAHLKAPNWIFLQGMNKKYTVACDSGLTLSELGYAS
jgi:hypothetical protein